MKNHSRLPFLLMLLLSSVLSISNNVFAQSNGGAGAPQPPMAEKKPKTTNIHGVTLVDDYFWMREKTNPSVLAHLQAENAYAEAVMKPTAALQDKLYNEMLSHIKQTDTNVPYRWGNYFYYTRTEEGKQYPIFCRKKGSTEAAEEIVIDENELAKGQKFMSVGLFVPSDDGNLLAYSTDNTGYRQYTLQVKDLRTGQLFPERIERVDNLAWANDNKTFFYVTEDQLTKRSAKNFRIVTAPVNDPSEKNWKEFVGHRPAVKVEGIDLFADHAVLSEWENGLQQLEVVDFKTNKRRRIEFPEPVYSVFLSANRVFNTNVVRYSYNSLVTPNSVFDYDMNTGKSTLLKQTEVPGGFDRTNYKAERVFATASDGTKIPMSVVYRKGVKLDGSAPMLLYGYGSYGASIPPTFSSTRLSLLDRGVIYVIAHIRGGGELGEEWRQAGRMMNKMNTFTDFIACAETLVKNKYTSKDRLVIQGASAGG